MDLRYIANGSSLTLDAEKCIGCGRCVEVCPHAVFALAAGPAAAGPGGAGPGGAGPEGSKAGGSKAAVAVRGRCMECGACARNCPVSAITV
ncbi:MAG: hypothetical protein A2Z99_06530, partial [Treponema sp. GWB1_62_6]